MENDQPTPGPWRWKFSGNAGNYFLYGNDGAGPITANGPLSADGHLKQAAPALLAACEKALHLLDIHGLEDTDTGHDLRAAIAEARGEG